MHPDWQLIVVAVCVLCAVAVLVWRCYRLVCRPSQSGCGTGCHACPSNPEAKASGLIQLEIPGQNRAK